jgi:hypothetical protein
MAGKLLMGHRELIKVVVSHLKLADLFVEFTLLPLNVFDILVFPFFFKEH